MGMIAKNREAEKVKVNDADIPAHYVAGKKPAVKKPAAKKRSRSKAKKRA